MANGGLGKVAVTRSGEELRTYLTLGVVGWRNRTPSVLNRHSHAPRRNENKPVGVEALAGGPASLTFNGGANPYRLKPLLQHSKSFSARPLTRRVGTSRNAEN